MINYPIRIHKNVKVFQKRLLISRNDSATHLRQPSIKRNLNAKSYSTMGNWPLEPVKLILVG